MLNIGIIQGGTDEELFTEYIYVYPAPFSEFEVISYIPGAGQFNIFQFNVDFSADLNAFNDGTTNGRIFIDFPTDGTYAFDDDLGLGIENGAAVGCNVVNLGTPGDVTCRLIKSPGNGIPASVELMGFPAITGTDDQDIEIYIAKVVNPAQAFGADTKELKFAIRTEHVTVADGSILPVEYTEFMLWDPLSTPTTTTAANDPDVTPTSPTFQAGSVPGEADRNLVIQQYGENQALAIGDFLIYEIPLDIELSYDQTCPANVDLCISFPAAGWMFYRLDTALGATAERDGTIDKVTIPSSIDPTGYDITCYAVHGGYDVH